MKILFNCTVNNVGGAVQNAANFIVLARADKLNVFVFIVSLPIYELLALWGEVDETVIVIDHPLFSRNVRQAVAGIEAEFDPDVVYTMAGPSYLRFSSRHVLGISDGYITHASLDSFFYARFLLQGFKHFFKSKLKGFSARFEGDFFIFQTEASRQGFCNRYFADVQKTQVVPNAIGKSFADRSGEQEVSAISAKDNMVILCPSADYPHKDLMIIERIANVVARNPQAYVGVSLKFVVTVGKDSEFCKRIPYINSVSRRVSVVNNGPYSYSAASCLYQSCDIVFMPSILETFSTSYLEALASRKLLLVADKQFSREICGGAAIYFRAKSEVSALNSLNAISEDKISVDEEKYCSVLAKYGGYERRYAALLSGIGYFLELKS